MKKNENYLERIPARKDGILWKEEDGIVTLEIENKGAMNRILQAVLKKPKVSYIHLDEVGSFVWKAMDGKKDITLLGEDVKAHFGEKAEPLYERLAKYFQILESYGFSQWK